MKLREVLKKVASGEMSVEDAEKLLKLLAIEEVGNMAKLDISRGVRRGVPEIVYARGKSTDSLVRIVEKFLTHSEKVIVSRLSSEQEQALKLFSEEKRFLYYFNKMGRIAVIRKSKSPERRKGKIGIITAGTADIPVAEEAKTVIEEMGYEAITEYDVGIAGVHRVFPCLKKMLENDIKVLIVVAGMEGALPSLVASLVDIPVIGVPTSTGYGIGGGGIGALISMLQSCSLGLVVVNIDNGVGAGIAAVLIADVKA